MEPKYLKKKISYRGLLVLALLTITAMVLLINPCTTPFATYEHNEVSALTYHIEENGKAYVEATVVRKGTPFPDHWTFSLKRVKTSEKYDVSTVTTKKPSEVIFIRKLYIPQSDYNTLIKKGELKY